MRLKEFSLGSSDLFVLFSPEVEHGVVRAGLIEFFFRFFMSAPFKFSTSL